jgi:6,7-dimethyl-8-ribityllumazine synthase
LKALLQVSFLMIHTSSHPAEAEKIDARVLIVEARYYTELADALLHGAQEALAMAGAQALTLSVHGALEIPTMVAVALDAAQAQGLPFDAVVTLGCVIRGETSHYDIVAGESARALMDLSVARGVPIGNAILTVENEAQAWARARDGNKGGEAARAALGVVRLKRTLPELLTKETH